MTDRISAIAIVCTVGEAIRDLTAASPLKGVPSGELYAHLQPLLNLEQYERVLSMLIQANLVERKNHLLSWIGPAALIPEAEVSKKNRSTSSKASSEASARPRATQKAKSGPTSTQPADAAPTSSVASATETAQAIRNYAEESASQTKRVNVSTGRPMTEGLDGDSTKQNILPVGQNNALPTVESGVSSIAAAGQAGNVTSVTRQQEKNPMATATLKFRKTDKSGSSSYSIEGVKSSVYFNKGMFAGEPPQTLSIDLPDGFTFTQPGDAKVAGVAALTPEQRKANAAALAAKRAAMTPAEKAAERLERARAALAAAEKAAQATTAPAATTEATA